MDIKSLNNIMENNDVKYRMSRGKRMYDSGLAKEVKSMIDAHYESLDIYGVILSENNLMTYDTNISLDLKNGQLVYTECGCADYEDNSDFNSNYICKHIGATFYKFTELLEKKLKDEEGNSKLDAFREKEIDYAEMLLKDIGDLDAESKEKEMLKLEVNLSTCNYFGKKFFYEADFKIGNNKTYVMKSINDFLRAKLYGEKLTYGKAFTYDSRIHYFSEEDNRIIDFIEEYSGLNETLENQYSYRSSTANIAKNKTLLIPEQAVRRFLEAASHKIISFDDGNNSFSAEIIKDNLPVNFLVQQKDDAISLKIDKLLPKPLSSKYNAFLCEENIYLPPQFQGEKYKCFYQTFKENNEILFKDKQKNEVFNKIIPTIETMTNNIKLDDKLEASVVKEKLEVEIYFDKDKKSTWANVELKYGEKRFNMITGPGSEQYIIRDLKAEEKINYILNRYLFYKDKGRFIFTGDDEQLFEFLRSDLKDLKTVANIYYSDRFKDRKVYGTGAVKATIKEGPGNYLDFSFNIGDISEEELSNVFKAFKEKRRFYKLKNESFISLEDEDVEKFFALLDTLSTDNKIRTNKIEIHRNRAMYIDTVLSEENMNFIEGRDIIKNISSKVKDLNTIDYKVPEGLKANLREYQIIGYKWFKTLSHYEFGGILADEMGLGKTLQTISFILSEIGKKSLVVTPTSLIYNWKNEFEKFAPDLRVIVLHGTRDERKQIFNNLGQYDVILTTYGTLRNDFLWYENQIFDYCFIDEGQNIKNPLSLSSEAVKDIKAKVKFALTGTPIENGLVELWSLFDFIMPGYLYSRNRFQEKFSGKQGSIDNLKKLIEPFILRRLKSEVMKELPDKIEKKFYVEMTESQKIVYSSFVKDFKNKLEEKDAVKDKITIFSYLTKLRQLCLDPSILLENYDGGSGKVNIAMELIKDSINDGHKILLFSQFTTVLDILKTTLKSEGIDYFYLDGNTKALERIKLVNNFNSSNDKKVFLISLKAGGTGLNLTSADMVIHFDPWWNPAIEDQATDRAHRFGQKNVVEVVKLISKGTIEEKIINLQENKKELIQEVMSGNYKDGSLLSSLREDEILELFN